MDVPDSPSLLTEKQKWAAYMRAYTARPGAQERLRARTARYRAANKETLANAQLVRYYKNHERELAKRQAFREAHRETIREFNRNYQREWRKKNPASVKASARKFQSSDKGRHARADQKGKRKARERRNAIGIIDWPTVWSHFTGTCPLCAHPLRLGVEKFHFDHRVALASGGAHSTSNLQVTHATCNLRKNRYPLMEAAPAP